MNSTQAHAAKAKSVQDAAQREQINQLIKSKVGRLSGLDDETKARLVELVQAAQPALDAIDSVIQEKLTTLQTAAANQKAGSTGQPLVE